MTNLKRTTIFFVLTVALGLFILTPAQAKIYINTSIPIDDIFYNECTEEDVAFSGDLHLLVGGNITPSGMGHLNIHINNQGVTGEGDITHDSYQVVGAANLTINTDMYDGNPLVLNAVLHMQFVSQGSADNLRLSVHLHITVNANGDVTATLGEITTECY